MSAMRSKPAFCAIGACSLAMAVLALPAGPAAATALDVPADPLPVIPSWQPPAGEEVRGRVFAWLEGRKADASIRARAEELWSARPSPAAGTDLLERVVKTLALADDNPRKLVELCSRPKPEGSLPAQPWLADPQTPPLVARNLRLWYGRWLARESLYDEALQQFDGLRPEDVVDPASLLFYQAVVHHRLVNQDAGIEAIERLLERADQGPKRYQAIARLMEADLRALKEDSLDHIARRMEDVERRLGLGRAGAKVRTIQDGVIKSLDKLIQELEAQQQQQQAMAGGNRMQPNRPANDSTPMEGKGRGEVTQRNVGNRSGWGNLPPKQREEALQQIGREFPAHYRDVIEQYFRKLATEGSP
jgi:hypothetical protein